MVTIKEILNEFQEKYKDVILKKSKDILTSDKMIELSNLLSLTFDKADSDLYYLKYYLYDKNLKDELFKLLEKNSYNNNYEIRDLLNNIKNSIKRKEIIEKYKNSPYIDNISINNSTLDISSRILGDYEIIFANEYFFDDYCISNYVENEKLEGRCHSHVEFLVNRNPKFYSITSLCVNRFLNTKYYHSYCYDKKTGRVIDLCYNIVMDKKDYDKLFNTNEIYRVKGEKLYTAYHLALLNDLSFSKIYKPIAATLFQQYIWENNFKTPDKKVYSERPKILMKRY